MDVLAMRRQGMSFKEIGDETGYHPATISKWVREGGPPPARTVADEERVIDPRWADRLNELLVGNRLLLATSLFEIISAEGFDGSYPTVARWVREQRGPRFRRADQASVPIETAPGEEAQFDFSDCSSVGAARRVRRRVVVLRDDLVLVTVAAVVVHDVGRPGAHLRRHRPVLRRRRRGPEAVPHRPDGRAGHVAGPPVQAAPADVGVRPAPRHRDQGLSGRRRQTQRQDRAPVPRPRRELPRGARRHRDAGRPRRAEPPGPAVARRAGARPAAPHDRCGADRPVRDRARLPRPRCRGAGSTPTTSRCAGCIACCR